MMWAVPRLLRLAPSHRRPAHPYQPPADVLTQLSDVFRAVLGPAADVSGDTSVGGLASKHRLLTACADRLGHHVSNSQLHRINTLGGCRLRDARLVG